MSWCCTKFWEVGVQGPPGPCVQAGPGPGISWSWVRGPPSPLSLPSGQSLQPLALLKKTISNTEYICTRAYKIMWILRRLKSLGCPIPELLDVLRQQVVSICEGSAAYWGPMITKIESNMLERCLKTGLHIIYQEAYLSFNNALQLSNMKSLKLRRLELITRFSKKALLSSKYRDWFCQSEERTSGMTTRGKPVPLLKPVTCRTQRYERSSLPFMTKMLSWHPPLRHISLDLA